MSFKFVFAIFKAVVTIIGFVFLSIVFYGSISSPLNIIIAIATMIIGLYISHMVFNFTKSKGLMQVIAGNHVSPELDNLTPTENDDILQLSPLELSDKFQRDELTLNPYSVSIWGDINDKKLSLKHKIISVEFNETESILTLQFENESKLTITNASTIYFTSSYLKIVKAKEINWSIEVDQQPQEFYYNNNGKAIETFSNSHWKPNPFDLGIGMNALYLQV